MKQKDLKVDKETAAKLEVTIIPLPRNIYSQPFQDFRKSINADAEDVIFRIFPRKVNWLLHLRALSLFRHVLYPHVQIV